MMRKLRFCFIAATLSLICSGCHVSSQTAMNGAGGRTAYNVVLQETNSEQMLLNLVRLRYFDSPFFLNVANITTQFTYKSSAFPTIKIPGFNQNNPVNLGGEFTWQNQPTIQYTPLEGQEFASHLLHPIDLRTIQQLIFSGWDIDLIFRLVVQSFDDFFNIPEASGPAPFEAPKYQTFFEVTNLLKYLQSHSQLQIGVKICGEKDSEPNGSQIIQMAFPDNTKEAKRLAEMLSVVHKSNGTYVLNLEMGFTTKGRIGIMPRSLLSCMYYLSNGIEVPEKDILRGKVVVTKDLKGGSYQWNKIVGSLINIRCASLRPKDAYAAVYYRNKWFYIDDCDLISKKTFLLVLQLYNLQAQASKSQTPILSLPLGS